MKNNLAPLSIWEITLKSLKTLLKKAQKFISKFSPNTLQFIQLTVMYFFAVVDLLHSVLNNVFSLGYLPEALIPFYPFIKFILTSPIFKIWGSPEKVFFMSYVLIELVLVRSVVKFSKLVKYNMLLLFACLMIQGLVVSYWDVLFHREVATSVAQWAYDGGTFIHTDKNIAVFFFLNTFIIFILGYLYLYLKAIGGKFATFSGMEWLTDSVAFWLRIKTPTMRTGNRKDKKNN
jgi:hypothetical protein